MTRAVLFWLGAVVWAAFAAAQPAAWEWTGVPRVVAVGDVHGRHHELVLILQGAELVDEELHWTGGADHLVLCGDLIDRGENDRAVLDLVRRLQTEAESAGGRVHALLGNHEVMNLMRDTRYVRAGGFEAFKDDEEASDRRREWNEYRRKYSRKIKDQQQIEDAFAEAYPPGYFGRERAFSMGGAYGDWLVSRPAVVKINGTLFLHGGLTPEAAALGLNAINESVQEALEDFLKAVDILAPRVVGPAGFRDLLSLATRSAGGSRDTPRALVTAAKRLLADLESIGFAPHGPLWYRGNSLANERIERVRFDAVLESLAARAMVVGHSVTKSGEVTSRFGGRLVRADVGLGYGRDARAIFFEGDGVAVFDPRSGELGEPIPEPAHGEGWAGGYVHLPDILVETVLTEGEVVDRIELVRSGAEVVELHRGGLKLRAVFKWFDEDADGARHELAAYAIDRLLGLQFVPLTVARSIDGTEGVLRPVIEVAIDLVSILSDQNLESAEPSEIISAVAEFYELDRDELEQQVVEARVFNALIGGSVREDFQRLVIPAEGRIALVDHDRAFPPSIEVDAALVDGCRPLPADLAVNLEALEREELSVSFSELLTSAEINALLTRRDRILEACVSP